MIADGSPIERHPARPALLILGVVLIVVGSSCALAATIVHQHLLDPDFYNETLDDQQVYRRVYAEVLTDPFLRDLTGDLLGDLDVGVDDVDDTVAVTVAMTRLALPPAVLRRATEHVISTLISYLRGETDRVEATVDLSSAIVTIDDAARMLMLEGLEAAPSVVVSDLPEFERAVRAFADAIERGRVPQSVPTIGGAPITEEQIARVITTASELGVPADVVETITAALHAGDAREALIAASSAYVSAHLTRLSAELAVGGELRIDVVDALGRRAGQPQQQVIDELNELRDWVRWFPRWTLLVGLATAVLGAVMIIVSLQTWSTRLASIALAFLAASTVIRLATLFASHRTTSPLGAAASRNRANTLPPSIILILGDVDRRLGETLRGATGRGALVTLAIAILAGAAAAVARTASWSRSADPRLLAGAVVVAVTGLTALVYVVVGRTASAATQECNGHVELCDRPYDQIVQAATHNSMSSPDVVDIWPEHDANISAQLNYGIRTLLIDTHYWPAVESPEELSTIEQALPPRVANYLFAELDDRLRAHPGTYLCHATCALGAVDLASALSVITAFLDDNPSEVVTLIIQNEIGTSDTERAFDAAGLDPYLFSGDVAGGWPTLAELIADDDRLVVFAESSGPPPDWYRSAGDQIQDTAFRVDRPTDFTCDLERGDPDAPLFLLNHWIHRAAPDRADATLVNTRQQIVDRARACASERGRLPNFVAVNFFNIGDVIGAVDQLNGVRDVL